MSPSAKGAARDVSRNPVFRGLARSGFAVNGLLHIAIGGIAIRVALPGAGGGEADQSGALQQVSSTPGGLFVIWAAVIGLFALGIWQFVSLPLISGSDGKKWGRRFNEAAKGVVYLALGSTALIFALGGQTSGSDSSRSLSAQLIATPGGVFLLVAIGLTVLGIGIGFVAIGFRRGFRKLIVVPRGRAGRAVVALGVFGYLAQGAALAVVGVLFVVAAVNSDAAAASGLDGALRKLAELPYGVVILVAVGIGFISYGVFQIARVKLARL